MISVELQPSKICVITLDDGQVNALDTAALTNLEACFLAPVSEAEAFVVAGRKDFFSAGLDRKVLDEADPRKIRLLLEAMARTVLRVWTEPRPVVVAGTGHAIGAGAMLALASDHVVACRGPFKWGLPETRLGFPLLEFQIDIARDRLRSDRMDDLLLSGMLIDPEDSIEAGFAHTLGTADEVIRLALGRALAMARTAPTEHDSEECSRRASRAKDLLARLPDDIAAVLSIGLGSSAGG